MSTKEIRKASSPGWSAELLVPVGICECELAIKFTELADFPVKLSWCSVPELAWTGSAMTWRVEDEGSFSFWFDIDVGEKTAKWLRDGPKQKNKAQICFENGEEL